MYFKILFGNPKSCEEPRKLFTTRLFIFTINSRPQFINTKKKLLKTTWCFIACLPWVGRASYQPTSTTISLCPSLCFSPAEGQLHQLVNKLLINWRSRKDSNCLSQDVWDATIHMSIDCGHDLRNVSSNILHTHACNHHCKC